MLSDNRKLRDIDATVEHVQATLAGAREQAQQALRQIDELEGKIRLARGTADVSEQAQAARAPTPPPPAPARTLAQRVEQSLRDRILSLDELARELGEPVGRVSQVLKTAKQERRVYNLGPEDRPRWTWRVGDAATTQELIRLVQRLITDQPLTTAELVHATGARAKRVDGVMVELRRRQDIEILDLGSSNRGRWFIVAAGAKLARLAPKAR